jgi:hypothetical protein
MKNSLLWAVKCPCGQMRVNGIFGTENKQKFVSSLLQLVSSSGVLSDAEDGDDMFL